jgi:hypothetical protein
MVGTCIAARRCANLVLWQLAQQDALAFRRAPCSRQPGVWHCGAPPKILSNPTARPLQTSAAISLPLEDAPRHVTDSRREGGAPPLCGQRAEAHRSSPIEGDRCRIMRRRAGRESDRGGFWQCRQHIQPMVVSVPRRPKHEEREIGYGPTTSPPDRRLE